MSSTDPLSLSHQELLIVVLQQQRQIEELLAHIVSLQAEIERLKGAAPPSAAPFAKGSRKANPQRPGRKPGQGPFTYRLPPESQQLCGPPLQVLATASCCP